MSSISPSNVKVSIVEPSNNPLSAFSSPKSVKVPDPKYHHLITPTPLCNTTRKMYPSTQAIVLKWDAEKNRYVKVVPTAQSSTANPPSPPRNPSPTFYRSSCSTSLPFKQGC